MAETRAPAHQPLAVTAVLVGRRSAALTQQRKGHDTSLWNWCLTGEPVSRQVAFGEACTERVAAIGSKFFCRPIYTRAIERTLAGKAVGTVARRPVAGWIVADAVHGGVELMALRRGHSRATARQLARGSGAATAAGVGLVSAGPLGAAVGLVGWMTGNWIGESTVETIKGVLRTVGCARGGEKACQKLEPPSDRA